MKGLDLSKFKKMSSDDACTILEHADGHSLKIAHKPLSPKMRAELEKLPSKKIAKKMADGGESSPVQDSPEQIAADAAQQAQGAAPAGVNININASQPPGPQGPLVAPMGPTNAVPSMQQVAPAPTGPSNMPAVSVQQAAPQQQEAPKEAPSEQQKATPAQMEQQPQQAEDAGAAAPQDTQPSGATQHTSNAALNSINQYKETLHGDLKNEDAAWENDLRDGHITPQTYSTLFAKKDTLGKIGTIFGLLVSGAGAGLTHQPNALLQMMDNQIRNDLEAQKQSKANAQNFVQMGMRQQETDASVQRLMAEGKLTRAQAEQLNNVNAYSRAMRTAYHSLVVNTNKLPTGSPERQQAESQLAMLYPMMGSSIQNAQDQAAAMTAYSQFMSGALNQSGSSNEEQFQGQMRGLRFMGEQGASRAKDIEAKHMPGLKGQASHELGGSERDKFAAGQAFDKALHNFMDWSAKHSGDVSPTDRNYGQTLAKELQGKYREATNGGVYKESEKNFISQIIDDTPTKFFNQIRVMPQLQAVADSHKQRMDSLAKSAGFPGYEGLKSDQSSKKESQHKPSASEEIRYDAQGNAWKLGPNGKPVRVK